MTAALGVLMALPGPVTGQVADYAGLSPGCLRFQHIVLSRVVTTIGTREAREETGWDGDIALSLTPDQAGAIRLEAWFTRLAAWLEAPQGRVSPQTDGVIGGRYRGRLGATGEYTPSAVPFVPEGLRAVADLSVVLDDLLPPRPQPVPGVGESWRGGGWTVTRLADATLRDVPVERYMVAGRRQRMLPRRDTGSAGTVLEVETGTMWWSSRRGPERWERELRITVTLEPDSLLPRGGRSEVAQSRQLIRLPNTGEACN